jgi:hypothetical protein
MAVEFQLGFLREIGENCLYPNGDWGAVLPNIGAAVEIVFIDHRPSSHALWTEHQVEGLAYRRLANIVAADQQAMSAEAYDAGANAPKVLDDQPANLHSPPPAPARREIVDGNQRLHSNVRAPAQPLDDRRAAKPRPAWLILGLVKSSATILVSRAVRH